MEEKAPRGGYAGEEGSAGASPSGEPRSEILTDWGLVRRIQAGEESAVSDLYLRYHRKILSYIYRFTGDRAAAEELAQEVFIRVIQHAGRLRRTGSVGGWIYRIARNLALNALRRRRLIRFVSLDEPIQLEEGEVNRQEGIAAPGPDPEAASEKNEREAAVQEALLRVSPAYRESVILCDIEGRPYREAAELLGCSINTVASRVARGRAQIARLLGYLTGREEA